MGEETGGEQVDGASGRWFEDLPVGLVVRHALTRTITEADNLQFCLMTHNRSPCTSTPSSRQTPSSASDW